ncbi:Uu.00g044440.m01.CDS01 [Anthostomella pinea]|uniref:non-specific serine/threonine protein kinase n=1 Tax=Anthostomella pinea TaxID=933095 RepID=A0AAI8VAZ7_9PEZI|nr:Uu.00g044440.m01.CDS01 [Anthostomella pinea]
MDQDPTRLAPPAVSSLRAEAAGSSMQRTMSEGIREERQELREAAEQTLNVIVDLSLDGAIRWVSPSWTDVIGTQPNTVEGTPIADLIISEDKAVFAETIDSMQKDDSRSQYIRFTIYLGPLSKLYPADPVKEPEAGENNAATVELEAQGIMVYDRATGGESHTMWMIRPWIPPREIKIDLPPLIVESLGSGAELLASYLTQLAESGQEDPENYTPPLPVLCRICERQIPPWWFEKHTDLCLQEHRAEMDVQMAQENLTEHRHSIVRVLDALEARKSRALSADLGSLPIAEYKGFAIGPTSSSLSPGTASPAASSRDRSTGFGHSRSRSFAVRRPQARIVELLLDLCDTSMEISTPAIKESSSQVSGEFRTQSPQSESRISQVLQWHSPGSNTLEQEQGLAFLCADTERIAKEKVEAVFRHRKIIEYAERIRVELAVIVQDCIDEAMRKAARIAAGRLSDSTEDGDEDEDDTEVTPAADQDDAIFAGSFDAPSSLALALRNVDLGDSADKRRSLAIESTRSSSPKECPTPRSHREPLSVAGPSRGSRRESMRLESDAGDSDGSVRSASAASRQPTRNDSPVSEFGDLRRATSSRQHHRRSLILAGTSSPQRQESPSRGTQPSSPLRILKPRNFQYSQEAITSPEASPMLPHGDFGSPAVVPHHRRQSSAAMSELPHRPPASPRLNAANPPPLARAVPPSIKDFEIIKPISKGAFGSVYLSKKKSTGEYFAIKVLKKADMIAKNQVTNVKAERAIMMWQGESEFVAKLYWTFSSKDYLYLVMEYLNGGDCASLVKVLGGLPEDWAKKYLGEVILGVEHLHSRGIIHRDLKPDNLLIDHKGHLKLTDFGLSRMGLIGRQQRALNSAALDTTPDLLKTGPFARSTSIASSRSASLDLHGSHASPGVTPQTTPENSLGQPSYFNLSNIQQEPRRISGQRSDSGGSESLTHMMGNFSLNDIHITQSSVRSPYDENSEGAASPDLPSLHQTSSYNSEVHRITPAQSNMMQPPPMALFDPEDTNRRFVGTPDYLAPETIRGSRQDETSDWWSVGCILFEFLYGIPPFNAADAEQVFENILARKIMWPEEADFASPEATDLMNKLLCIDPRQRLGSNRGEKYASGGEEIRNHPWFEGTNWASLLEDEAQFVPQPENPEDTEYFDARGATLQSFTEEMEDQMSPGPSASTPDYPDRPHDALSSGVRSQLQVNQIKRGLMPLHIPPHIRDLKSRRLSEPVPADDFGTFAFKNLTVLEKANKDVIQQLKAQAMAAQNRSGVSPSSAHSATSPSPGLEGSPVLPMPIQRNVSNARASASQRPASPSAAGHANSSPNRASQPSSPLLVSFHAGQGADGRRKVSSNSSSLSQQSGASSLQPGNFFEAPRTIPALHKSTSSNAAASPIKGKGAPPPLALSPQKSVATPRQASGSSTRSRSLTVGSQEGSPIAPDLLHHRNRRSQVFADMSPSSSDNEGDRAHALLKVQRRRQSSRRMSAIMLDSPSFRSLDVLVCEDHPVSRMVMEKLLEKLRCRTISASTGSDAVRYAVGDLKFDIIFTEFKLPEVSGSDVARMVREVKNVNAHTPIVAITAYLKELQAPHYFDSLIEKPISSSKLVEVLSNLCQWKPHSPGQGQSVPIPNPLSPALRTSSARLEDSPTSGSSGYIHPGSSSFRGSSREDSIGSSLFGDSESVTTDDVPVVISRKATGDWGDESGLEINNDEGRPSKLPVPLVSQSSAPAQMEQSRMPVPRRSMEKLKSRREHLEKRRLEGSESADDEDEELGTSREPGPRNKPPPPSSKLGIEMMRANSHESLAVASDSTVEPVTQVVTPCKDGGTSPLPGARSPSKLVMQTPPEASPALRPTADNDPNETPRPAASQQDLDADEPTPRPTVKS